ncbi:MAG: hypothetical protein D8H97_18355 [Neisseria sp.]|nr:MAG: hypothetical protein D8H97_18355 [Neisseria sp.]
MQNLNLLFKLCATYSYTQSTAQYPRRTDGIFKIRIENVYRVRLFKRAFKTIRDFLCKNGKSSFIPRRLGCCRPY